MAVNHEPIYYQRCLYSRLEPYRHMPTTTLLPLLADGEFHSGQDCADQLGISRTAVWKQLRRLADHGLELESVRGRGYRIPGGLELLDSDAVRKQLAPGAAPLLDELAIHPTIDSTNAEALRRVEAGAGRGLVCTAEQQLAGRGRRGRPWVSPFGRNLYVSLVWEFTGGAAAIEGLSLATGVAVARALADCGLPCDRFAHMTTAVAPSMSTTSTCRPGSKIWSASRVPREWT